MTQVVVDKALTHKAMNEIKKIQSIPNESEKNILIRLFEDSCKRKTYHVDADSITGKTKSQNKCEEGSADDSAESVQKKRDSLDSRLKEAVTKYNAVYTLLNDHGTKLFSQRERSIDLLDNVGAAYKAEIELDKLPDEIRIGMEGNCDIIVGKRSVLDYFIEPFIEGLEGSLKEE